jgi:hypothetical protein
LACYTHHIDAFYGVWECFRTYTRGDPFCNWIALIKPPFLGAGESTFEGWGNAVDTNAEGPAYGWG